MNKSIKMIALAIVIGVMNTTSLFAQTTYESMWE